MPLITNEKKIDDTKPVVAIIGHTGMVGSPVYRYFKERNYPVMGMSLETHSHTWKDINDSSEYIFIAVPTPFDWIKNEPSIKIVREVLDKIQGGKVVIIKSTILPGTTSKLQEDYPWIDILFNPEFLSAKTNWQDFVNPDRQLVGYTDKSYKHATKVLNMLPVSPYDTIMRSEEAEISKYINNFHGALMVMFANFFYDICKEVGADFEVVKKASMASKWVGSPTGRMYWDVFHGGFRGYGGGCFPKDINSLLYWCIVNGIDPTILEATRAMNIKLLANQDMTEESAEQIGKKSKDDKTKG